MNISPIKHFCVKEGCGKFIEGDPLERYLLFGNYHQKCSYVKQTEKQRVPEKYAAIIDNFLHKEVC